MFLGACAFLIAWAPSLTGPFHFDDHSMLRDPMIVNSMEGLREIWRPLQTRPLTELSFWINYQIGGDSPFGFHLVNFALHALNTALVWRLLQILLASPAAAFAATAVFALHPFQSEPVNYVFARSTLLMSAFCLGAMCLWIRERFAAAAALFGLAVLAKEECVTFPLFLLFVDWSRGIRVSRERLTAVVAMLGLALAAGLRAIAATAATPGSGAGFTAAVTPLEYFRAEGPVIVLRYLRMLVVPLGFTVDPQVDPAPSWALSLGMWVLLAATCVFVLYRQKKDWFWFAAGILLLLPSSSVFPAEDLAADRRLYLPMVAFGCLIARQIPLRASAVLAVALAALSCVRTTQVWNAEETLWREAAERAPGKVRPRIQLARVAPLEEARRVLDEAAKLEPANADIPNELGLRLIRENKAAEALGAFGKALALAPGDAKTLNNRGVALYQLGQKDAARQDFLRALQADPKLADARANLALAGVAHPR